MRFAHCAVFVCMLPLGGCFEFDVPLGPATVPIDRRLIGDWRCTGFDSGADADKVGHLRFHADDATHYEISSLDPCEGSECMPPYRAHITKVGKATILNAQEIKKDAGDEKWSFVRATLYRPNILHLSLADDDKFKDVAQDAHALKKAVEKRMLAKGVFVDYMVCVKPTPSIVELTPEPPPTPTPETPAPKPAE
jgi:hypothetical protein